MMTDDEFHAPGGMRKSESSQSSGQDAVVSEPIRIVVADDHGVTRSGIRLMVDALPGVTILAEASTGIEAVKFCRDHRPDIVLMDLQMPQMDGIEATKRIKDEFPDTSVLVLTVSEAEYQVSEAIRAGASGYLAKSCTIDDFAGALRSLKDGGTYMTPAIAGMAIQSLLKQVERASETASVSDRMTDREGEVLGYLAQGLSARSIATRMGISERTVNTHIGHLYRKLDVNNRVDAVLEGMRLGLVEMPA